MSDDVMRKSDKAKAPPMRGGVKVLLFSSLALNLLVAGLVVGALLAHRGDHENHPPRLDRISGPMTRALSLEDKRVIGKSMRAAYRDMWPSRADSRADYDAMAAALRADPFDPEDVRAAMERQLEIVGRRANLGRELLLDRLSAMSPEERAGFADRLIKVLKQPNGRGGKRRFGSDHPHR